MLRTIQPYGMKPGAMADKERSASDRPVHRSGGTVKGVVVRVFSPETALVRIGHSEVLARSRLSLKEGMRVLLKAEPGGEPTVFKSVVGNRSGPAANLSVIFSAVEGNLWKMLSDELHRQYFAGGDCGKAIALMRRLSREFFTQMSSESLRQLIDGSGLHWEAKLRKQLLRGKIGRQELIRLAEQDMKGVICKILGEDPDEPKLLMRFVSTLSQIHLSNRSGISDDGKIFLPVPVQLPDGALTVIQLMIRPLHSDAGGGEKTMTEKKSAARRVSIVVDLSGLGPMRADLAVIEKRVEARFLVSRPGAKQRLESNMPMLSEKLAEIGFALQFLGCGVREEKSVSQSLLTEFAHSERTRIHVRA